MILNLHGGHINRKDIEKLAPLAEELAEALQNSVHDNINVFRVTNKIKDLGYELGIAAEFNMIITKSEDDEPAEVKPKVVGEDVMPGTFTEDDVNDFSKAFRIKL